MNTNQFALAVTPNEAGNFTQVLQSALIPVCGLLIWMIGSGRLKFAVTQQWSANRLWWVRLVGILEMGFGTLFVIKEAVTLFG